VPQTSLACTASPRILITASCVNAVTDVLLLAVPIPLLWTLNRPLPTRILVFVLLASGLFVLAACITRVSLTVVPNISVLRIARWGIREFAIAIVAVNTVSLRPLFRRSFWRGSNRSANNLQKRFRTPAPVQRVRQYLSRSRNGVVLNSTSAGASTINAFAREQMGEDEVLEDPDYPVADAIIANRRGEQPTGHSRESRNTRGSYVGWNKEMEQQEIMTARRKDDKGGQQSLSQKEIDLEKGEVLDADAALRRTDSGMPRRQGGDGSEEDNGEKKVNRDT